MKIGQFVTIPTGSYCQITLHSGEKIVVNHEAGAGGHGARLTIDRLKLFGFSSENVFPIALDTAESQAMLRRLEEAAPGEFESLLRRFVSYLQPCESMLDVVGRCQKLRRA